MQKLEEIDDDADEKDVGFVKISDEILAYEYGLEDLPSLVYYRKKIPIVYSGVCEIKTYKILKIKLITTNYKIFN